MKNESLVKASTTIMSTPLRELVLNSKEQLNESLILQCSARTFFFFRNIEVIFNHSGDKSTKTKKKKITQ
jgi:hypothetical protein